MKTLLMLLILASFQYAGAVDCSLAAKLESNLTGTLAANLVAKSQFDPDLCRQHPACWREFVKGRESISALLSMNRSQVATVDRACATHNGALLGALRKDSRWMFQ